MLFRRKRSIHDKVFIGSPSPVKGKYKIVTVEERSRSYDTMSVAEDGRRMVTLDEYLKVRELAKQGIPKTQIAERFGIAPVDSGEVSERRSRAASSKRASQEDGLLGSFEEYLRTRVAQGCTNGKVVLRKIEAKGYREAKRP